MSGTSAVNKERCDFCSSIDLERAYTVPDSALGVSVLVCLGCGLVQSSQTIRSSGERVVSTSSGPGWGNIRHGKGLRFKSAVQSLSRAIPWQEVRTALDIGSNRGDFVNWLHSTHPHVRITGVEPDSNLIHPYQELSNLELHQARFENVYLADEAFDLIYSCHTLEHAGSAAGMLEKSRRLLRPGGWMYLEVPNLDFINDDNIVEEFFIDKHTFHFTRQVLVDRLESLGFDIVEGRGDDDCSNICFVVRRGAMRNDPQPIDKVGVERNIELIRRYERKLSHNRLRLVEVADKLYEFMGRQKVVLWGAGRIFDALVQYGNLRTDRIFGLVDSYLAKILQEVHGVPIRMPDSLRRAQPDVVVVLAKSSAEEIARTARRFGVRHVILLNDLLASR